MLFLRFILIGLLIVPAFSAFSVPVDWSGELTLDTDIIRGVRRTSDSCTPAAGSQCITDEENNGRQQNMIMTLNPSIIINDGVTIKGELATGTSRTSQVGDDTTTDSKSGSYFAQTTSSGLNVNQIYAEIYADTALYRVGRFAKNFGLGALINSGEERRNRYFSGYEGIEAELKLGNFYLTPAWTKLHTSSNPNGKYDAYETSLYALYDNTNRNLKFGVFYALREVETESTLYGANTGSQEVTLIDIFIQKNWEKAKLALEIPMVSGNAGKAYTNEDADFDSNAYILESSFEMNTQWKLNLNAGYVKGDDGETNSFEGMYLHPNYKVGKILYNHNLRGYNNSAYDIHNAAISNSTYAQLEAQYSSSEWVWKISALWAKANQVASEGDDFYDHEQKSIVTAAADQADDLGYELTTEFDYMWNPSVTISGYLSNLFVGDFYSFLNDADDELKTQNVMATGMSLSVKF